MTNHGTTGTAASESAVSTRAPFATVVELNHRDGRAIAVGLYQGAERIGCAWETTVADGLFNWCLFAHDNTSIVDGYGHSEDGYDLSLAVSNLIEAATAKAGPTTCTASRTEDPITR